MTNSNLRIEHQCPQCGAPAVLEETDHLFKCAYCRVPSYLASRFYRYILPHSAPAHKELIYFPYWRFKGMLFSCVSGGIQHRVVDVSYQALDSIYFPNSVGLRSQALKLRFVTPQTEGLFLQPQISRQEMVRNIEHRYSKSLPKPLFHQAFIGETISQIYSPFYIEEKVYDAILNRPVSPPLADDFDISAFPGGNPNWQIKFIPAQCPDCGWDLAGTRDALVLECKNCNTMWQAGRDRFMKLKIAKLPEPDGQVVNLPFWRLKATVFGLNLNSYADLVKLANLPKGVQKDWKKRPFHFWTPAFKVRPQDFLRLSRNLTLSQPYGEWIFEPPNLKHHPVTLPILEAAQSLKLNLAGFIKPPQNMLPKLSEMEIKPQSFILAYIPFNEKGNEITHTKLHLRLNRNVLRFAKNL